MEASAAEGSEHLVYDRAGHCQRLRKSEIRALEYEKYGAYHSDADNPSYDNESLDSRKKALIDRLPFHDIGFGFLSRESKRREAIGHQVDPQDLYGNEWDDERIAEYDHTERQKDDLVKITGEEVFDEFLGIIIDTPPLFYGCHDRGKVII